MNESASQKIKSIQELQRIAKNLKKNGKIIVHCHGVFDLIHPGHIRHFESAKKHGDVLIVTITSDPFVKKGPGRPIFPQELRAEVLAAIEHIDFVSIVDSDSAVDPIRKIAPHYYVKGPDYKLRKRNANGVRKLDQEAQAIVSVKGKLIFTDDPIVFSSSSLINAYLDSYPPETKEYLMHMRKTYPTDGMLKQLSSFKALKILVIGDAIIDQYYYCLPMGKSSKEPIMVHRYVSDESFLGGAMATANHLASLSNTIHMVTLLGNQKSFQSFIKRRLKLPVQPKFFLKSGVDTIIKRRFVDAFTKQKLFQITYLEDEQLPEVVEKRMTSYLKKEIASYDLVVVNDFGHGTISDKMVQFVSSKAKFLALNVQANSANYGFNVITKYPRADFVCIDDAEIRLALHDKYSELPGLIRKIYRQMSCKQMIVTKGPKGAIAYNEREGLHESPALTDKIVDRIGAGDALFAITSPLVYAGMNQELVSFVGNVAGALQVQTIGNKESISYDHLSRFITRLLK